MYSVCVRFLYKLEWCTHKLLSENIEYIVNYAYSINVYICKWVKFWKWHQRPRISLLGGGGDEPFIIDKEVYLYTLKALMGEIHNWSWFVLEESGVLKCG